MEAAALHTNSFPFGANRRPRAIRGTRFLRQIPRASILWLSHTKEFAFPCNMIDLRGKECSHRKFKWRPYLGQAISEHAKYNLSCRVLEVQGHLCSWSKVGKKVHLTPFASTDDGVTVNGTPQATTSSDMEEIKIILNHSLEGEDLDSGIVQCVHDAARAIELSLQEYCKSSKKSQFWKGWINVDKNAWLKTFSYQAAVYSLLQAAIEISSLGDIRVRDTSAFVQRSIMRLSAPLEGAIRDQLLSKEPEASDWFWSLQHPAIMATFVDFFKKNSYVDTFTKLSQVADSSASVSSSDLSLVMISLNCLAAIMKLGSAKVSCSQFFSMVPDIIGKFMDILLHFISVKDAYCYMKDIGLCTEFLFHFGTQVATMKSMNDQRVEEAAFWVDLIEKRLQHAIDRERIWSRLTTSESIEVLEKDLAIFGIFIALGRSSKSFLKSFMSIEDPIESFIRYLVGGVVLYYPQLSSISSYQLYVEVVCEELEWLPFYQSPSSGVGQREGLDQREAISQVLAVCSYWMTSFIKYSTWIENPSSIKAKGFISQGRNKLNECLEIHGLLKNPRKRCFVEKQGRWGSAASSAKDTGPDSFDKALEGVEDALIRLEDLLQKLHLSNANSGKEHIRAACSDLENIRKLKKEAEFLEASFRAKSASLEEGSSSVFTGSSDGEVGQSADKNSDGFSEIDSDQSITAREVNKSSGFWGLLVQSTTRKVKSKFPETDSNENRSPVSSSGTKISSGNSPKTESYEIHRFELLRNELIELENRMQKSTDDEESDLTNDKGLPVSDSGEQSIMKAEVKDDILAKFIEKIRKTSTDVLQGTQLLAIDAGAAMVLLRRTLTGDDLTEKEKKALRRTLTDLASVIPIGFLMLLPVTAVGHAAMLAAIQRYAPSLIPSTYSPERLDLLRQLKEVKEMENGVRSTEEAESGHTL